MKNSAGLKNKIITAAFLLFCFLASRQMKSQTTIIDFSSGEKKPAEQVKKNYDFSIYAGAGLGFGIASSKNGQNRTMYSGDLSITLKGFICSYRYLKGEEIRVADSYFFPDFSTANPREYSEEKAFLFGKSFSDRKMLYNLSAGLSTQKNVVRGAFVSWPENYETILTKNKIGFPFEAEVIRHNGDMGFGAKFAFNISSVMTTCGIFFTVKLGYFGQDRKKSFKS